MVKGAFGALGRHSVIQLPSRLNGVHRIHISDRVFVGAGTWLQTLDRGLETGPPRRVIGPRCNFPWTCTVSVVQSVELGTAVLMARGVYISDHVHAYRDVTRP